MPKRRDGPVMDRRFLELGSHSHWSGRLFSGHQEATSSGFGVPTLNRLHPATARETARETYGREDWHRS